MLASVRVALAATASLALLAAAPATKPGYQVNIAPQFGAAVYAPLTINGWIDSSDTTLDPAGKPRPASLEFPIPVQVIDGGGGGGGSSTPTSAPGTAQTQLVGVQGAPGGLPVSTQDANNASYSTYLPITPSSGTYTTPTGSRALALVVTTGGNIAVTGTAGNVMTFPVVAGFQILPLLPVSFTTTATLTAWGVK